MCTCEETCQSVWPPNASLYESSTCGYLRLLASPFGQGLTPRTDNRPTAFPDQVAVLRTIPSNDDVNVAGVTNPEYPL